jgi:hypothetical protein
VSIIGRIMDVLLGRLEAGAPERLPSPDALVLLARPHGEAEAQLFHDMLEHEGIRSMIRNTDAASARAGGMGPPWAYELWVLRRDLRRAREILELEAGG